MEPDLSARLSRVHAALGVVCDINLGRFPSRVEKGPRGIRISNDFTGGETQYQLSNSLHTLIQNVASVPDHLARWARRNKIEPREVRAFFEACNAFLIIVDLNNNDKHGYPPRSGSSKSGKDPVLGPIHCVLQLSGNSLIIFGPDGKPSQRHGAPAQRLITAEVWNGDGTKIGDIHALIKHAINSCEAAIKHFGVVPTDSDEAALQIDTSPRRQQASPLEPTTVQSQDTQRRTLRD